jgi:pimeloyl-ACP methyl ester carboxylesterase
VRPFAFIYFLLVSSLWAAEAPQPLLAPGEGLAQWKEKRGGLIARWEQALGLPTQSSHMDVRQSEVLEVFMTPEFKGTVLRQRTGPETWQRILLMEPLQLKGRSAGVVVPFYDPDRMCGYDLKTKQRLGPERNTAFFGLHLVQQGYVVAAVEAYPFNVLTPAEQAASKGGMGVWRDAAAKLAKQHPQWTGMGKLTHDTRLAAEVLRGSASVDPERIAVMGHSLGGKMAFYAGCLDPRFKAIIASDFGLAWDSTNWGDAWYFGSKLQAMRADGLSPEQLLAVTSTPFFLIAGQYDSQAAAGPLLEEARKVRALQGQGDSLVMFDHHSGHQPTWPSLKAAYAWLARRMDMPAPDFAYLDGLARERAKAGK